MKPIIVINFKTYRQGRAAVDLAKEIQKVSKDIIVGVQSSDIYETTEKTGLKVYSQHADYEERGKATGFVLPEAIKADMAAGTFLNHSEHKLKFDILKKTMKRCRENKLKIMVFASSVKEALKIEKLKPDYLIYEPPELVGGKISVSKSKPEVIRKISEELKMKFLVGAGIHSSEDVAAALRLGAAGIAVSSVICKARNPGKKLKELLNY